MRSLAEAALRLGIPERLARAGLAERVGVGRDARRASSAAPGSAPLPAALAAPAVPGRLSLVAAVAFPAAGFMLPDALCEREARRRMSGLVAALPDALDLLAVGAEAGRSPGAVLGEIAAGTSGPARDRARRRPRPRSSAARRSTTPWTGCASAFAAVRSRR